MEEKSRSMTDEALSQQLRMFYFILIQIFFLLLFFRNKMNHFFIF